MRGFPALLALVLIAPGAAAGDRPPAWQAPYSTEPVGFDCNLGLPVGECPDVPGPNVQFGPFPAPESIDVRIEDEAGVRVGAEVIFYDEAGAELGRGWVCQSAKKLPAPDGSAYVRILVDTALTTQHCPSVVPLTTLGIVTMRLRD